MYSIRTKTALLTVCAIVATMTVATLLSVIAIKKIGDSSSNQALILLCEVGEKNLDSYFSSVEQSVEMVSSFAETDLANLELEQLESHVGRVSKVFEKAASKTNGVLTYYYRIDPAVSDTVKGFWRVRHPDDGFQERAVTDITLYDTSDTSKLVWFTVPKATGNSVWLPPYITDNLGARVISYNIPIYRNGLFVGVIGIEIDYSTMAAQADHIKLYENGYAFISDADGNIIYHPRMDIAGMDERDRPKVPDALLGESPVRYDYNGVEKQAVWLSLENGMRLNVTVPVSEINENWVALIYKIFVGFVVLLIVFIALAMRFAARITEPLQKLTEAAKQVNDGNYDLTLDYKHNDEVGILTRAFSQLIRHLKVYINGLNDMVYADALTSVRNKGGFDMYIRDLQAHLSDAKENLAFAVGVFDCDNLKLINDQYGHDKGDIYLKTASALICNTFKRSPVFRTGGDEFTVILQNDDYRNRMELAHLFEKKSLEICASTDTPWEQARVSMGIAAFDQKNDRFVGDVVRRADKLMYEHKRARKAKRALASKTPDKAKA